jgi:uncharacterized membrane protein (DUF2068 family)
MDRPQIPALVRVIAWFEMIGGALAIMNGIVLLSRGGWLLILPGIIAILGGWGLLRAKLWAYYTVVVIAAINIVLASPLLTRGRSAALFTLIVNTVILFILLGGQARGWAQSLRAQ